MMRRPPYSVRRDGYDDSGDNGYASALDYRYNYYFFRFFFITRDKSSFPCFLHRDGIGEPFPPELKGSPEFESVTTVCKSTFGTESDDNLGTTFRHAQPSGTIAFGISPRH